jgi:hypothetical protein
MACPGRLSSSDRTASPQGGGKRRDRPGEDQCNSNVQVFDNSHNINAGPPRQRQKEHPPRKPRARPDSSSASAEGKGEPERSCEAAYPSKAQRQVGPLGGKSRGGDADPSPHRRAKAEGHVHDRREDRGGSTKKQFLVRSAFYSNRLRLFLACLVKFRNYA